MLFNSYEFLLFLPLVFAIYWIGSRRLTVNNIIVVAASYVFYGWWDWRFLFLIALTTALSFASGILIDRARSRRMARMVCGANIAVNICILGVFKYFNFFVENLRIITEQIGFKLDWFTIDVLLPVGISFYTFQALSYTIDVYRGQTKATRDAVAFTAFIAFFPQLVAGPIERSTQLLPQFLQKRHFDYTTAVDGMRQILWGFFKKLVIADNCAALVNTVFRHSGDAPGATLLIGGLLFAFQIYGDFSGYSDIAVGTAKLFGIKLMRNFNLPYYSRDIAEFWRRWHISLNTWFIDYVYIPLGGSRGTRARTFGNIMTVFLLSGLWHGAAWTFVLWGAYNGVLIIAQRLLKIRHKGPLTATGRLLPGSGDAASMLVTFILVVLGWIIFRSDNITQLAQMFGGIFGPRMLMAPDLIHYGMPAWRINSALLLIALCQAVEWLTRRREHGLDIAAVQPRALRWGAYLALICLILIFAGSQSQFIYFQF